MSKRYQIAYNKLKAKAVVFPAENSVPSGGFHVIGEWVQDDDTDEFEDFREDLADRIALVLETAGVLNLDGIEIKFIGIDGKDSYIAQEADPDALPPEPAHQLPQHEQTPVSASTTASEAARADQEKVEGGAANPYREQDDPVVNKPTEKVKKNAQT